MKYNILITGGLGHIGSHLIENLPSYLDCNIIVYDNLLTQRYSSLFHLSYPIKFVEKSFVSITTQELRNIDIVIHLAAITDATNAEHKDIEKININDTIIFFNQCKDVVKLFIFPSSTSVYGKSTDIVYEDNYSVINPQSYYAEAKYEIEKYIIEKTNNWGPISDYLILRLGTIGGISMGMRFHTAINSFCYKTAFNQPLKVWKENYEQMRPYLSLQDLTSALYMLIERPSIWNHTYNVVSQNIKLSNIIEYIQSKKQINIDFVNTPLLNQFSYIVSNEKLKSIGWNPQYSIEQCIDDTLGLLCTS